MIENSSTKNNEKPYKQKRSISSKIGDNVTENRKNISSLRSRHRKVASSYFLGTYVSGDDLDEFIKENNIPKINPYPISIKPSTTINNKLTNISFHSFEEANEVENSIIIKTNDESSNNCETKSDSFNNNNNNVQSNFYNNPFYELEKNSEKSNSDKSFIQLRNGLKFLIDKEERVTDSYLMALNGGDEDKHDKKLYLPTSSIIEEEKSEFMESTSKKPTIVNMKIGKNNDEINQMNFENKFIKNKVKIIHKEDNKENININNDNVDNVVENIAVNKKNQKNEIINNNNNKVIPHINISNNINNKIYVRKSKLTPDLNKIYINNKKNEEVKKKIMQNNKMKLLNSFFLITKNTNTTPTAISSSKDINKISHEKNKSINICNNLSSKNIISTSNDEKPANKKIQKLPYKNKRTFSYGGAYISYLAYQRFNTDNSNKNILFKNKTKSKKNLDIEKIRAKKFNTNSQLSNCDYNDRKEKISKFQKNLILSKIKVSQKLKKIPHIKYNNKLKNKNFKNEGRMSAINIAHRRAVSISRESIGGTTENNESEANEFFTKNSNNSKENNNIKNNETICILSRKIVRNKFIFKSKKNLFKKRDNKSITSLASITNKNELLSEIKQIMASQKNINTPNESKSSRIKNKKIGSSSKSISGSYNNNYNLETTEIYINDENINISNKKQTEIILKEKIQFDKGYEKQDVLEIMNKTLNCEKSNFLIFCDILYNNNFMFKGLLKYYANQRRFIKICGDKKCPNVISIKSIDNENYFIYESKITKNEENVTKIFFNLMDDFYFTFNSIIICKK